MIDKNYLTLAIMYLFVDIIWISYASERFYNRHIETIQQSPLVFDMLPAILAYMTLLLTMFFICIPLSEHYKDKYNRWFVFGVVGFCVYGIYNFTNGAIFKEYNSSLMAVDVLWGIVSFSLFGALYDRLASKP